jgi:hypothetical protein
MHIVDIVDATMTARLLRTSGAASSHILVLCVVIFLASAKNRSLTAHPLIEVVHEKTKHLLYLCPGITHGAPRSRHLLQKMLIMDLLVLHDVSHSGQTGTDTIFC